MNNNSRKLFQGFVLAGLLIISAVLPILAGVLFVLCAAFGLIDIEL